MTENERSLIKPSLLDVKQMMEDRIPRSKIAELSGYSLTQLCYFALAWGIPSYGKAGPKRKGSDPVSN